MLFKFYHQVLNLPKVQNFNLAAILPTAAYVPAMKSAVSDTENSYNLPAQHSFTTSVI